VDVGVSVGVGVLEGVGVSEGVGVMVWVGVSVGVGVAVGGGVPVGSGVEVSGTSVAVGVGGVDSPQPASAIALKMAAMVSFLRLNSTVPIVRSEVKLVHLAKCRNPARGPLPDGP
jgi:hypothetical protein